MYINIEIRKNWSAIVNFDFWKLFKSDLASIGLLEIVNIKANETEKWKVFWIKHEQEKVEITDNFKDDEGWLKLLQNGAGIFECRERVQGIYPIYIPWKSLLPEKAIYEDHN